MTTWSYSAKACERGSLCSLVKPCGIISLSKAGLGEGPVARLFSLRAVFSQFILYRVSNCGLWQPPQVAGSVTVVGRVLLLAVCASSLPWQDEQARVLCRPLLWILLDRLVALQAGGGFRGRGLQGLRAGRRRRGGEQVGPRARPRLRERWRRSQAQNDQRGALKPYENTLSSPLRIEISSLRGVAPDLHRLPAPITGVEGARVPALIGVKPR